MSRYLDPKYSALVPYIPGEQPHGRTYIKLNTNESPFPPSPKVREAIDAARIDGLHLYNDPAAVELGAAIAEFYGVAPENIVPTGGSDEALGYLFLAYCSDGKKVLYPDISYGFYKVFAALTGADARPVPLDKDWHIVPQDYYHAGGTVLVANPNAPTGLAFPLEAVAELCRQNPDNIVVIDEAYADFNGCSAIPLIKEFDNLIVIQTFSKSRALAGARIGFAAACKALAADLNLMKFSLNPYDIDSLAQAAGIAAMKDTAYFESCTAKIVATRERVKKALAALGCTVLDSRANFVFVSPKVIDGGTYAEKLEQRGILTRYFPGGRTGAFLRVTIGSDEEMDAFLAATEQILKEERA